MSYTSTNTYKFIPSAVSSYIGTYGRRDPELLDKLTKYFDIYLISFGTELVPLRQFMVDKKNKLSRDDFIKALENAENEFNDYVSKMPDNTKLFIDSGGFQLSFKGFHDFVYEEYPHKYYPIIDKISSNEKIHTLFYLDIPEARDDTYKTFKDDNMRSFEIYLRYLKENSNAFSNKMAFIIQFNSPERLELWNYFLDNVVSLKPSKYAVGGLVASRASLYTNHPVLHWSTGLLMLLERMVKHNTLYGNFHMHLLGVTTFYYIISSYIIFEYLSYKTGFRFDITYDGTQVLQKFVRGRKFTFYDEKEKAIHSCSAYSRDRNRTTFHGRTNEQIILETLNSFLERIGYSKRFTELYDSEKDALPGIISFTTVGYETSVINELLVSDFLPVIRNNIHRIEKRDKGFLLSIYQRVIENESRDTLTRLIKQTLQTLKYIDDILDGKNVDLFSIFYKNSNLEKLCLK